MTLNTIIASAVFSGLITVSGAAAQGSLADATDVNEGLIAVGIAYEISEECSSLSARTFRGLAYLNRLRNRALELGFSGADVDAYTKDKVQKDRLEGIARARLAAKGAVVGQAQTYCTVGRAEIAADTAIGRLLR